MNLWGRAWFDRDTDGLSCRGISAFGCPLVSEEGRYIALVLIPSSSTMVAILSMPVSRRRAQTSGGNLGMVRPRASKIKDRISMQIPRAVSQVRARIK